MIKPKLSIVFSILTIIFSITTTTTISIAPPLSLHQRKLTQQTKTTISDSCSKTQYPTLCINTLLTHPSDSVLNNINSKNGLSLVQISVNATLNRVGKALYGASTISNVDMDTHVRSAYEDCLELLDDSMDQLSLSLNSVGSSSPSNKHTLDDVMTWLSSALTNHDTCTEGFEDVKYGYVKDHMDEQLKDLSQLVSNCLALFAVSSKSSAAKSSGDDFDGIPIENGSPKNSIPAKKKNKFPGWVKRRERHLLDLPVASMQPNIIVSKDGNGTHKTIAAAIKAAPQQSNTRTIIYIKAGRYEENNLKVGRKKINLMFIGDGKGKTIISGGLSVLGNNVTTFHTAAFAATGTGFIARDITFENYAGPAMHQAVALRVGADHAVVYRCNIIGYQDSLYVHSNRQFFRECDIYGTVDFIFGNAAVVIQNCSLYARKPMAQQKITVTAQNRKDPNQNTGMSIHNSRILAAADLVPSKNVFQTYLGRPWKMYSRVVYMMSYMGDHVHPRGWLEWNDTFALDTLYYGEYLNYGPGGAVGGRVKWPGYRVLTSPEEAGKFTVSQFIFGSSWLPSTGVSFVAGLSV
ncbi:hypothetical protein MKW94_010253 [Papaver nudicaule]|uniref:Pectinesterase n=1 Tax=Papaver nudicaule TaxID=74823 RepID=A0AA41VEE5_PAPNU|nr:hypothetical protein [Papaver nudicaule]